MSDTYVVVGKFGAVHGVHGWIKVYAFTEITDDILSYQPWYINRQPNEWLPLELEDSKPYQQCLLVKIAGIHSPEAARAFTGLTINIPRAQLPPLQENEYYWSDLIGLTVINQQGATLGKVTHLMATGSNDVLVIKNEKEYAIPYLMGSVIKKIDLDKQEIIVDWELI